MENLAELFLDALREIRTDVREIKNTQADHGEVLAKNTTVLEEHESRSTASEKRLEVVEAKLIALEGDKLKVKGFFYYAGLIGVTLTSLIGGLVGLFELFKYISK